MNRDQLSELLSAYIDGEVDDRERALAERVLREDASARQLLEELRRTISLVASLPRHAAPPTLAADLDAQLERAELLGVDGVPPARIPERGTPRMTWMAMAAMLGVVVIAGWWFLADYGPHRRESVESKIVTADADRGRTAAEKPTPPAAVVPSGPGALASRAPSLTVESQLAAGVDPAALTRQSFEPEAVRLQVVAMNTGERDALAEKVVKRLSEQRTENLAKRRSGTGGAKEPVESFFLVGKPGVNFDDPKQQQVLVRVRRSKTAQVVDDLTAVAGSEDRVALQAGPISVRGAASARNLLQMVGKRPPEADTTVATAKPGETKPTKAESKTASADDRLKRAAGSVGTEEKSGTSKRFDLLNGLAKVVGLDPDSLARRGGAAGEQAATPPPASPAAVGAGANVGAEVSSQRTLAEKKSLDRTAPDSTTEESRSLVKRRELAAEKAQAKAKAAKDAPAANRRSAGEEDALEQEDGYVTIVIEFVVPSLQPKPVPPTTKPRTDPASKSTR